LVTFWVDPYDKYIQIQKRFQRGSKRAPCFSPLKKNTSFVLARAIAAVS
jgi:hypothetical protein